MNKLLKLTCSFIIFLWVNLYAYEQKYKRHLDDDDCTPIFMHSKPPIPLAINNVICLLVQVVILSLFMFLFLFVCFFYSLGIQTHLYKCRRNDNKSEVAKDNCFALIKPEPLTRPCNLTACERYTYIDYQEWVSHT